MPPNSESVCAAISLAESGSDTSTRTASALPPSPLMPSATFCAPSTLMSATTTAAPSRASASAYAWPMPPPAPVTMATFSLN